MNGLLTLILQALHHIFVYVKEFCVGFVPDDDSCMSCCVGIGWHVICIFARILQWFEIIVEALEGQRIWHHDSKKPRVSISKRQYNVARF